MTMHEFLLARITAVAWLAAPYADHPDYREEWRPVKRISGQRGKSVPIVVRICQS